MAITTLPGYPGDSTTKGATCGICGLSQRQDAQDVGETVYDLGLYIEMEGTLVICTQCAEEIGHAAGMIRRQDAKTSTSQVNRAEYRLRKLKASEEAVNAARQALDDVAGAMGWNDSL